MGLKEQPKIYVHANMDHSKYEKKSSMTKVTKQLSHGMSIDMPTLHIRMVLKNHQQWDMAAQFRNAALPGENRITVNRG